MANPEYLQVFLNDRLVGTLRRVSAGLTFAYDREWLDHPQSHPLSLSLPLREIPFTDQQTRTWFGNLLPEGDVLTAVARRLGRSTGDIFGLLVDLGGECAGAVRLLSPDSETSEVGHYQQLSEKELYHIVTADPPLPLLAGESGVRLSLAGAQNKVPVLVDGDKIYKATGSLATSHILKPPIRAIVSLPYTVENEYFCMQLADRLGLFVPHTRIATVGNQNFYLIERFDRYRSQGKVERLHQEDFCQALGIEANLKYEESGGPALTSIGKLLRRHSSAAAADMRQLLRWIVFNFLIGNADAHGKNLALLYGRNGSVRLSPFYDLLCTAAYPELDQRLAMRIGGERKPERLRRHHWERLAEELDIAPRAIFAEMRTLTQLIEKAAEELVEEVQATGESADIVTAINEIIRRRTARAWAFLGGRPD